MAATAILFTLALAGVDAGWQKLSGGGYEYIIQIEPASIEALRGGQAIVSDVPAALRDIRSYRVQIGSGALPRETPVDVLAAEHAPPPDAKAQPVAPADPAPTAGAAQDVRLAAAANGEQPQPTVEGDAGPMPPDESSQRQIVGFRPGANQAESLVAEPTTSEPTIAIVDDNTIAGQITAWAKNLASQRPLVLAGGLGLLLFSIGANLFLAWITWGARSQYRALVRRVRGDQYHIEPAA